MYCIIISEDVIPCEGQIDGTRYSALEIVIQHEFDDRQQKEANT